MNTYSFLQSNERSRYQMFASQFYEFRKALETVRETFSQEQIWPDQCDYVIYKMDPLKKTANSIANSIKKRGGKSSGRNHYPLLVNAYYLTDQIDILIDYVREYKEVTEQRSAKKLKQKMIVSSLHSLESSLKDLIKELDNELVKPKVL